MSDFDLLIIGGGINGAAIAREAALNGLKVLLVEKGDLAGATSSASTKLIHGGLRYLEFYEFKLVREALIERERLLKAAPHLIHPLAFVLPHENAPRPWWMIRAGLFLYDHIGGRISLPKSRGLRRDDKAYRAPLKGDGRGFVYSDAWVDDARLVVLNARDAADHGAEILTRTALVAARREDDGWRAVLGDGREVAARAIVNAAGPWVSQVAATLGVNAKAGARLIKGSHIVVPRMFDGDHAYILQQPDKRIVFAIAYERKFTLIGTTDIAVDGPENPGISDEETDYLLASVNRYFTRQIARGDIVSTYAGIRSLYDDGASESRQITRDYVLELDANGPPLLSVFGGKITTARKLAEEAMAKLGKVLPHPTPTLTVTPAKAGAQTGPMSDGLDPGLRRGDEPRFTPHPVTRARIFPGGEIAHFGDFLAQVRARWPFLGEARAKRMASAYGSMLGEMLADVHSEADMGQAFGAGFTEIEARWMRDHEWARTPEDCLMRRSKLVLHLTAGARVAFEAWWDRAPK